MSPSKTPRGGAGTVFGFDRDELDERLAEAVYTLRELHALSRDVDHQGHPRERAAIRALHIVDELRDAVRRLEPDGTVRGSLAAYQRQAIAASEPRSRRKD